MVSNTQKFKYAKKIMQWSFQIVNSTKDCTFTTFIHINNNLEIFFQWGHMSKSNAFRVLITHQTSCVSMRLVLHGFAQSHTIVLQRRTHVLLLLHGTTFEPNTRLGHVQPFTNSPFPSTYCMGVFFLFNKNVH
jgi:hypothetical protein